MVSPPQEGLGGSESRGGKGTSSNLGKGDQEDEWGLIHRREQVIWLSTVQHTHIATSGFRRQGKDPFDIFNKCPYRRKTCEQRRKGCVCILRVVVLKMSGS